MSILSPKRVLFAVLATALLASNAFASNPSPRSYPRAAWDSDSSQLIVFGGSSALDIGTARSYDSVETWAWTGTRWSQRFPAHTPPGRTAHHMTHDSARGRVVLFGGRQTLGDAEGGYRLFNDTWVYDNGDWSQLSPAASPDARQLGAFAYDSVRDRIVLFGGVKLAADGITAEQLYDTWEFDGTNWTKAAYNAVEINRPVMAYDKARGQMILVGNDADLKPKMYRLDVPTNTWIAVTPEKLPGCANDAAMVYQEHSRTIMMIGGVCTVGDFLDKTTEWNGTTWTEIKTADVSRGTALALGYDPVRQTTLLFGGFDAFSSTPRSSTMLYRDNNWRFGIFTTRPSPRSLFSFSTDPATQTTWLIGGLSEYSSNYLTDIWGYRGGQFFTQTLKTPPPSCDSPMAALDTTRNKLVYACWLTTSLEIEVFEFDGIEFKNITSTKSRPSARRWAGLAYDENLKKVVLFGGFDVNKNFKDDTWTWDGANWTEVKKNKPPNRALHTMWYDPIQKKVILYGGIGRESIDDLVDRFNDMWSFNGTGWTKLNVTNTPGQRLGPQYAVDPASGKLLLFGGLKAEQDEDNRNTGIQYYDNETWQWDGGSSTWTKLSPVNSPSARQNGRLAFDPISNRLTLFGGYAGFFFSDIWTWTGSNWEVLADVGSTRRRSSGPAPAQPPTSND